MSASAVVLPPVNNPDLRIIKLKGDSMMPTMGPWDFAIVDPHKLGFDGNDMFAMERSGNICIYRAAGGSKSGMVRLWVDNPAYGGHEISKELFDESVLGKVVGTIKMLDVHALDGVVV